MFDEPLPATERSGVPRNKYVVAEIRGTRGGGGFKSEVAETAALREDDEGFESRDNSWSN